MNICEETKSIFLVRVITKSNMIIEKEISARNEYHALLDFVEELCDDYGLYYEQDYVVNAVVQVKK